MKLNSITSAIAFGSIALALASCSNIDEDNRYIYVEPATVSRSVLIEDFTGQRCVNCPAATAEIEALQAEYGSDNIIAVGLHSGPFAKQNGRPLPLYSETADYYYNNFGVEAQPSGMIDRHGVISNISLWGASVRNEIQKQSPLKMTATTLYNSTDRTVQITVTTDAILSVSGNLNVWLLEDGIVSPQYLADGSVDRNYVHNHVFREAVTNRDGKPVSIDYGNSLTETFTYTIPDNWVAENMSVVAFIDNADGVQQATKVHFTIAQ